MQSQSYDHFKNKSPEDHLKEVKDKHRICKGEPHATTKGLCYNLANDILFQGAFLFFIRTLFFLLRVPYCLQIKILLSLGFGWSFFQSALIAKRAWSYMELAHRCIQQEKEEIDNNYEQEKIELNAIYKNHGFKQPLVNDMVEFVASDTTLLLDTMIREELHIELDNFLHPIKQGGLRLLGGLLGLILFTPIILCASFTIAGILTSTLIVGLSYAKAKILENDTITETVWVLSIFITSISLVCLLFEII